MKIIIDSEKNEQGQWRPRGYEIVGETIIPIDSSELWFESKAETDEYLKKQFEHLDCQIEIKGE